MGKGRTDPAGILLRFDHNARNRTGVLRTYCRIEWNFCQPSYSTSDRRQGYGFPVPEHAFILVLLHGQYCNGVLTIYIDGTRIGRVDGLSVFECSRPGIRRFKTWDGSMDCEYGPVRRF